MRIRPAWLGVVGPYQWSRIVRQRTNKELTIQGGSKLPTSKSNYFTIQNIFYQARCRDNTSMEDLLTECWVHLCNHFCSQSIHLNEINSNGIYCIYSQFFLYLLLGWIVAGPQHIVGKDFARSTTWNRPKSLKASVWSKKCTFQFFPLLFFCDGFVVRDDFVTHWN